MDNPIQIIELIKVYLDSPNLDLNLLKDLFNDAGVDPPREALLYCTIIDYLNFSSYVIQKDGIYQLKSSTEMLSFTFPDSYSRSFFISGLKVSNYYMIVKNELIYGFTEEEFSRNLNTVAKDYFLDSNHELI